jgi:hypothetical protein
MTRILHYDEPLWERIKARIKAVRDRYTVDPNPHAIFILGTQKSGTSAIAWLLAERCGLRKAVDIPQLWPPDFQRVYRVRGSLRKTVRKWPRPFSKDVVKEPYLVYLYDELAAEFPQARFVYVVRDPRDTLRSVLNRLGVGGDLPALDPAHHSIPQAWHAVLDPALWGLPADAHYIDVLAHRWVLASECYRENADRMTLIRYEDFDQAKLDAIDDLARELGYEPVADIRHRLDVQFQPAGEDRGIAWNEFFSPENLERIHARCGPLMEFFGYGDDHC